MRENLKKYEKDKLIYDMKGSYQPQLQRPLPQLPKTQRVSQRIVWKYLLNKQETNKLVKPRRCDANFRSPSTKIVL